MSERPILFNDAMVRAILDGSKTQTRRPVKLHFADDVELRVHGGYLQTWCLGEYTNVLPGPSLKKPVACPFGQPGGRLWMRECWQLKNWSDGECAKAGCPDAATPPGSELEEHYTKMYGFPTRAIYRASYNDAIGSPGPWRPSIHMPRWASRITLVVKRVWVERVQDISSPDTKAEGFREIYYGSACSAIEPFVEVWDSIYAAKGCGWDENPWVWACEFERRPR